MSFLSLYYDASGLPGKDIRYILGFQIIMNEGMMQILSIEL